jgi:hypothetical protein
MLRKLLTVAAALVATAGLGLAAAPAQASVIPHHGEYKGHDASHPARTVSFTYSGTQMSHFTINHQVFGGAHVSHGAWHETCHNGFCTKGQWTSDGVVRGAWRHGGGHWTSFEVHYERSIAHHRGTYIGRDQHGKGVNVHLSAHNAVTWTLDQVGTVTGTMHNNRVEACNHTMCFRGHWQHEHEIVGSWWHKNSPHHVVAWDVWAISH